MYLKYFCIYHQQLINPVIFIFLLARDETWKGCENLEFIQTSGRSRNHVLLIRCPNHSSHTGRNQVCIGCLAQIEEYKCRYKTFE